MWKTRAKSNYMHGLGIHLGSQLASLSALQPWIPCCANRINFCSDVLTPEHWSSISGNLKTRALPLLQKLLVAVQIIYWNILRCLLWAMIYLVLDGMFMMKLAVSSIFLVLLVQRFILYLLLWFTVQKDSLAQHLFQHLSGVSDEVDWAVLLTYVVSWAKDFQITCLAWANVLFRLSLFHYVWLPQGNLALLFADSLLLLLSCGIMAFNELCLETDFTPVKVTTISKTP